MPGKAFVFACDQNHWCIRHHAPYRPFGPLPVTRDFHSYRSGRKNRDDCMHISGSAGFIGTVVTDRLAIAAKVPVTCHVLAEDDREV